MSPCMVSCSAGYDVDFWSKFYEHVLADMDVIQSDFSLPGMILEVMVVLFSALGCS